MIHFVALLLISIRAKPSYDASYHDSDATTTKLRCPDHLEIAWVNIAPYIFTDENEKVTGVFPTLLKDIFSYCCKDVTNFTFTQKLSGFNKFDFVVKNNSADIIVPIYGNANKKYLLGRPYLSLVDSPGISVFTDLRNDNAKDTIVESLRSAWPALLLVILSALVAGTIFWLVELASTARKKDEQNKDPPFSRCQGAWEGFYWAMVSMTTVGYGDFYPKSFVGRLLSTVWILVGTIILSLFTASVTTVLLASVLTHDFSLNGAVVAVLEASIEYGYAVKRNAFPIESETVEGLSRILSQKHADAILLDSYVAGYHQGLLTQYNLADIMERVLSYGVLLNRQGTWLEHCGRNYVEMYRDVIFRKISSSIKPLKPTKAWSVAEEKSTGLLDIRSTALQSIIIFVVISLILLTVAGVFWDRLFLKKKKKKADGGNEKNKRDYITVADLRDDQLKETYSVLNGIRKEMIELSGLLQAQLAITKQKGHFETPDEDLTIRNVELHMG